MPEQDYSIEERFDKVRDGEKDETRYFFKDAGRLKKLSEKDLVSLLGHMIRRVLADEQSDVSIGEVLKLEWKDSKAHRNRYMHIKAIQFHKQKLESSASRMITEGKGELVPIEQQRVIGLKLCKYKFTKEFGTLDTNYLYITGLYAKFFENRPHKGKMVIDVSLHIQATKVATKSSNPSLYAQIKTKFNEKLAQEKWYSPKNFFSRNSGVLLLPHKFCDLKLFIKNRKDLSSVEMLSSFQQASTQKMLNKQEWY